MSSEVHSTLRIQGRDTELAELHRTFQRSTGTVVRTLTGLPGVGKTSLACAYARQHQAEYDLIWWINAEDPAVVEAQFRELLEHLTPHARTTVDTIPAVHRLLAARPGRWLLVVDNLDGLDLGTLVPASDNGHVLVTTRNSAGHSTPVAPLDHDAAVRLLNDVSGDPDVPSAAELADLVGCLPLALAQAGAFCHTTAMPLAAYLEEYRERRAVLHDTGRAPGYNATVATTWKLAFDRLTPDARELLTVLAFCAPENIPVHVLFAASPANDRLHLHTCMGELLTYGLMTRATEAGSVTMHRLVRAVVHDRTPDKAPWADKLRELLYAAWPSEPFNLTAITRWRALQPHLLAVVEHLSDEDPNALNFRHHIAWWTGWLGDAAARDMCANLIPLYERVHGKEDPTALITRHNHALWTNRAGDTVTAGNLNAELALVSKRVLGPEHHDTLVTRYNHATTLGERVIPSWQKIFSTRLYPSASAYWAENTSKRR